MLFGHVRGAFTGATADRKGWFELADGGTLFLDEIGDMPAALQAKLLRVLEDGEITPVGASSPSASTCASSRRRMPISTKMADGSFREDLYFRLARYLVETPPLRERPGTSACWPTTSWISSQARWAYQPALTPAALSLL